MVDVCGISAQTQMPYQKHLTNHIFMLSEKILLMLEVTEKNQLTEESQFLSPVI